MRTVTLPDDQWAKLRDFLKRDPNAYVGQAVKCCHFVEAVLWIARSGAQWRLLPSEYGVRKIFVPLMAHPHFP